LRDSLEKGDAREIFGREIYLQELLRKEAGEVSKFFEGGTACAPQRVARERIGVTKTSSPHSLHGQERVIARDAACGIRPDDGKEGSAGRCGGAGSLKTISERAGERRHSAKAAVRVSTPSFSRI